VTWPAVQKETSRKSKFYRIKASLGGEGGTVAMPLVNIPVSRIHMKEEKGTTRLGGTFSFHFVELTLGG